MTEPMAELMNEQILNEASTWFIEHRAGPLSANAHEAFMTWLRRSPEHIRAYLEVSRTYARLPAAGEVPTTETYRLLSKAQAREIGGVVAFDKRSPLAAATRAPPQERVPLRWMTLAASLIFLVGAAAASYFFTQRGLYVTGPGEARTVTLEDASRIELNARTRLRVRYTAGAREVELLEGQALFQVAKDHARPFIVHSGSAQVRAVGTEFDVYRHGGETTVTVLEGTVAVLRSVPPASDSAPSPAAVNLLVTAGEQAVITPQSSGKPRTTNVSAATAWTRGQLEFEETPLSEVADEFNRSSTRTLVLMSPQLTALRINGVYSSVDPTSLILFLKSQPDLLVTEAGNEIQVRAKGP